MSSNYPIHMHFLLQVKADLQTKEFRLKFIRKGHFSCGSNKSKPARKVVFRLNFKRNSGLLWPVLIFAVLSPLDTIPSKYSLLNLGVIFTRNRSELQFCVGENRFLPFQVVLFQVLQIFSRLDVHALLVIMF